jgi:hypothetical protein
VTVDCEEFALCSSGCGWLFRAALCLECERWYVGMAVPEDDVGGLLGMAEQLDVGAAAPKFYQCWGLLGELASTSSFERHVSTPPIVVMAFLSDVGVCPSFLTEWCFSGLVPFVGVVVALWFCRCCMVFARFSAN